MAAKKNLNIKREYDADNFILKLRLESKFGLEKSNGEVVTKPKE